MDKLKQVFSHGHKKEEEEDLSHLQEPRGTAVGTTGERASDTGHTGALSGEGTHLAGANAVEQRATDLKHDERHPIYDEFTGKPHANPTGEPTRTADRTVPHSSDSTNLGQRQPASHGTTGGTIGSADSTQSSTLSPTSAQESRPHATDDISNASIKSGVLGFPQSGATEHAALANKPVDQPTESTQTPGSTSQYDSKIPATSGTEPQTRTTTGSGSNSEHHYGRDAALGAGAGAAAGGLYADQQKGKADSGPASSTIGPHKGNVANVVDPRVQPDPQLQKHHQAGPTPEDPATKTVGPHKSNIANALDPRVQPDPEKMKGHTTTGPHQSDTLNKLDPKVDPKAQPESQHHYGRDAAIAGGLGAAGAGTYAASKHRDDKKEDVKPEPAKGHLGSENSQQPNVTTESSREFPLAGGVTSRQAANQPTTASQNKTPTFTGPVINKEATPKSTAPTSAQPTTSAVESQPKSEHHYGRDAAILGGTGAAGYGAYEASKHHKEQPSQPNTVQSSTTQPSTTHPSTTQKPLDTTQRQTQEPQHHYGRDAALAGGLGTAGAGTYIASQHESRDSAKSGVNDGREGLAGAAAAVPTSSQPEQQYAAGVQPVGRDMAPPTTTTTESSRPAAGNRSESHKHIPGEFPDPTPAEERSQPSYGGDMAAAGATAAWNKHETPRPRQTTTEPLSQKQEQLTSDHHYGRDAALAGAVGASGLGAYEAGKHRDNEHTTPKKEETTIPAEASPYSSTKMDPRVDAKPSVAQEQRYDPTTRSVPSVTQQSQPVSQTPFTKDTSITQDKSHEPEHHYGRDAAIIGGTGAAGYGAHEALKGRDEKSVQPSTAVEREGDKHVTKASPQAKEQQNHYGRDAAIVGGTGAAGYGAHEALKGHDEKSTQPSTTTAQQPSAIFNQSSQPTASQQPYDTTQRQTQDPSHHYGRDAALAGGVGAAGYGAHEAANKYGEHKATQPSASMQDQRYDPRAPGAHQPAPPSTAKPQQSSVPSTQPSSQHHYGRDTAIAGGAGAAGLGAYEAGKHHGDQSHQPTTTQQSSTVPEQSSYQTQPHDPTPKTTQDPTQQRDHHYGRDAAIVGGTGAAGLGAYEAGKHHGGQSHQPTTTQQPSIVPGQSSYPTQTQPYDTTQRSTQDPTQQRDHHYGRDAAIVGGTGAAGYGAHEAAKHHGDHRDQPTTTTQQPSAVPAHASQPGATQQPYETTQRQTQDPQHHYGRDAAVAGGAGALGAGAYAASRDHKDKAQDPAVTRAQQTQEPTHQRYDSTQDPNIKDKDNSHKKEAAAAAGAAGVAGAGAYEYSKHDAEKERLAQQKELEKQQKQQQKELDKQHKAEEKQVEKEEKKHEKELEKEHKKEEKHAAKAAAAEEKKHQKEAEKEEKKHQKEVEKEEKKHEKEVAAAALAEQKEAEKKERDHQREVEAAELARKKQIEEDESQARREAEKEEEEGEGKEKKKHHLFGFLHRDKKDKHADEKTSDSESPSHSKEYAGAGTAAAAGAGAAAYEHEHGHDSDSDGKKERHRLHKDPPLGHPAREAMEHSQHSGMSGKHEHMGIDGPIGNPNMISGDHGAHPIEGGQEEYRH